MARAIDTIVIGAGTNGLVAAIRLARGGAQVLVVEAAPAIGGALRTIEFAPGFRAAPLAPDAGWIPPEVARGTGLGDLEFVAADPTVIAPTGDGQWLELRRDPTVTAQGLRRFSNKDADQWPGFVARLHRIAGFLSNLYRLPAPDIDTTSVGELWDLLQVGRKLKGLGQTEMIEVLRTVPMAAAELLDEWFEHELLKGVVAGSAITDICQGPMSGGTAFTLLHHHVGSPLGAVRGRSLPRGGATALINRLSQLAKQAGVEIRAGTRVDQILIRDDRVAGVTLATGEEVLARTVVSTADPRRTLLGLLDPVHLDPELILAVRNIRYRGAQAKVLLGLDGLPELGPLSADALRGALSISPSIRYLEKAYDATKYGQWSAEPYVEARIPTLAEPELAPNGQHVMVLHVQYAPYRLKNGEWDGSSSALGDAAMNALEKFVPGVAKRVKHRAVLTPKDLERQFGLTEGAVTQGEMMLDQILFMRPVAGYSRYATPMTGLFLAGSGTHPGGGITGASGWLAADQVLKAKRD